MLDRLGDDDVTQTILDDFKTYNVSTDGILRVPGAHAGCAIIFWPLSFVLPNALRAANDVKFTMVVSILSMACWRLGFSYLLCVRMGWGAVGVWVAMVIDWTCRVTCFVLRFRSGAWKTKYQA